ncbi:MAG TPA: amidohydrolase family protein [Terriglobales bacterium]|nr:amidohydrolase family protein [Terriglobales bacterium]
MNSQSKWVSIAISLALAFALAPALWGQANPLPKADVSAIYNRLLAQIEKIPIVDMHGHPGFWDDTDVDAMAVTVTELDPQRTRATNPEWADAAKALYGYPYSDFSPEHVKWLYEKDDQLRKQGAKTYFDTTLDKVGIQAAVANRVAMDYFEGNPRFRWVVFVDPFMFPFNNRDLAINPDRAVFFPIQEKALHRYLAQAGVSQLPPDLAGYESAINKVLEQDKNQGALAIKFEAPYFRSLVNITDPPREKAEAIYSKYVSGGVPTAEDYLVFQDYIFRYLIGHAGPMKLEVHIHSAVGSGNYYHLAEGNAMDLEDILRDPRYKDTIFVLIHGGYPYDRQSIWLAALPNVYLDSSEFILLVYPAEYSRILKNWFEIFPEKVLFGSDCFPYSREIGVPETYWVSVRTARVSAAAALAQMVSENEVSEARALEIARDYFHDSSAKLFGLPTLAQTGK